MSFQVYYRKWRPQQFRQLVGQEHVSTTLLQAVKQGRVAHSYLFCGPRGTGKTSTARVMAKAVNCLNTQEGDPCNECGPCLAVNEGRFMDLIELDAASNRGIDEIRNIREKVNLAPAEGTYKVYIIDESHMLTDHASNAFLKTLEEPPHHVMFIMCTTEPHKILPTIISRCQRFDFRRITSEDIVKRLRSICLEGGVDSDEESLAAIARAAGGSLRDAENLLEQLVVSFGNRITKEEVHQLMGSGQEERALEFTSYLLMGNTSSALAAVNRAAWDGVDLRQLNRQVVNLLRGLLMLQYGSRDTLDMPKETIKGLEDLAPRTSTAKVVKALKILGGVNVKYDASSTLPMELAVVEVCIEDAPESIPIQAAATSQPSPAPHPVRERTDTRAAIDETSRETSRQTSRTGVPHEREAGDEIYTESQSSAPSAPQPPQPVGASSGISQPPPKVALTQESDDFYPAIQTAGDGAKNPLADQWDALVKTLSRQKGKRFNLGALLRACKSQQLEGETLVLGFAHRSHLERIQEELDDPQGMKIIREALSKVLGVSYQLRITLVDDNSANKLVSTTQSHLVRSALSMGARIMEER